MTNTKAYKVETKPTIWEVTLSYGCYSDAQEKHIFFSANDENEVWNFLCRYIEDINRKKNRDRHYCNASFYDGIDACGLTWGEKKYHTSRCDSANEKAFDCDYGGGMQVEIQRLDLIYFNS